MTIDRKINWFSSAQPGWRAAIATPDVQRILVVPIIGWANPTQAHDDVYQGQMELDPVILFDNVEEPIIARLSETLEQWAGGETLHQILTPGTAVRKIPDGWTVGEYAS